MGLFSRLAIAFTFIGSVVAMPIGANAAEIGCDNRQDGSGADPNAISAEITLPYGYLCHAVQRKGKEIKEQRAAYTLNAGIYAPLVDNICNWRIDFVYYDTNGDEYIREKGDTVSNCKQGASRAIEKSKTLPQYGATCAQLIVDGEPRLTQCQSINE
ncbi:MAG: hypothetical protein ACFCUR_04980 [Rhodomicrobiaceae bacterium]